MESSFTSYSYEDSAKRTDEILDGSDNSYIEVNSIPSRASLTFNNGYYVNCSAMFVDMRDSKKLTDKYKRPRLAKIYRSYISELVAVLKDHPKVAEVNIEGDAVWGIYDTISKQNIDQLFYVAAKVSSLIDILNWKYSKRGVDPVSVGIGLSYGRALMIKAGYKGSGVNEVVWMGDVVNEAARLASRGNKNLNSETMVSSVFYQNLCAENQNLLSVNYAESCYHGNVVNIAMNKWLNEQQLKDQQMKSLLNIFLQNPVPSSFYSK